MIKQAYVCLLCLPAVLFAQELGSSAFRPKEFTNATFVEAFDVGSNISDFIVSDNTLYIYDHAGKRIESFDLQSAPPRRISSVHTKQMGGFFLKQNVTYATCEDGLYRLQGGTVRKVYDIMDLRAAGSVGEEFYLYTLRPGAEAGHILQLNEKFEAVRRVPAFPDRFIHFGRIHDVNAIFYITFNGAAHLDMSGEKIIPAIKIFDYDELVDRGDHYIDQLRKLERLKAVRKSGSITFRQAFDHGFNSKYGTCLGTRSSSGYYILFVDSDEWLGLPDVNGWMTHQSFQIVSEGDAVWIYALQFKLKDNAPSLDRVSRYKLGK